MRVREVVVLGLQESHRFGGHLRSPLGFHLPDEMDQAPPARPEYLVSGIRTPPVRRNSKLATLGRIFKPWKWRKKKNEKLKQTTSGKGLVQARAGSGWDQHPCHGAATTADL